MQAESGLLNVSPGGDENLSPGKTAPGVEEGRITASVGSLVLCVMDHDSEHRHV